MTETHRLAGVAARLRRRLIRLTEPTGFTAEAGLGEKWLWAWHAVYYGVLLWIGVCLLFAGDPAEAPAGPAGGRLLAAFGLSLLLAGWHAAMVLRPAWRRRPWLMGLYLAGALAIWTPLQRLSELYLVFSFVIAAQAFALLPLVWAIPAAAAITGVVWLQAGFGLGFAHLSWLLAMTVAGLTAGWHKAMARRSAERQRLLDELRSTRDELAKAERQAGQLEERQRLAREIHDTVAQEFTSIVLHLEAAEAASRHGSDATRHLEQARRAARQGLAEARRLVLALRPELLDGRSLPEALQRLTERWSRETGVSASLQWTARHEPLPREVEATLLRVAQEALANVRKHADARRVTLTVSEIGGLAVLDVQDDGAGFPAGGRDADGGSGTRGGFGLLGMRERVETLGGRLLIESAPGEGTTVVSEVPIA